MQKSNKKKKRYKKLNKRFQIAAIALACIILAGVSFTVYSKYYKTDNNKGIAIASGFYFSSNYMTELNSEDEAVAETIRNIKNIDELVKQPEIIKLLSVKASDKVWTSGTYSFGININNYTNQLLYNDIELDMSYNIEFLLLDEPLGAGYYVRKGDTGDFKEINKVNKAEFTGDLKGGQISSDRYQLEVRVSDWNMYNTARILVLAYPTSPSYLTKTGKLAGIITANYREGNVTITNQGFTIEDSLSESDWQGKVKEVSALEYQVRTTGGYINGNQASQTQMIKITWNPEMYVLNQYDKYREPEQESIIDEEKGEMIIKTNPYSMIKFVFFKKEEFNDAVGSMTKEEFLKSVHAEMITQ